MISEKYFLQSCSLHRSDLTSLVFPMIISIKLTGSKCTRAIVIILYCANILSLYLDHPID